ncbi:hypothetical protein [Candidatus Spongiihabitans sp.]|uniref:hypothetical protein n=1 Tax=Candidatus Spongiihabitans sp. TaxID=3101308 RepID=UPI003C6EE274
MPKTARTLIQICLFKAKPQDLEASVNLLILAIAATLGLFMVRNNHLIKDNILFISLVQAGLPGLGLKLLLVLFSKPERWLQSATALYGCSALLLLIIIPFIMMSDGSELSQGNLSLTKIPIIASSLWYFTVIIFIFRETLEISRVLAFFITLVLELSFATILLKLFGDQLL